MTGFLNVDRMVRTAGPIQTSTSAAEITTSRMLARIHNCDHRVPPRLPAAAAAKPGSPISIRTNGAMKARTVRSMIPSPRSVAATIGRGHRSVTMAGMTKRTARRCRLNRPIIAARIEFELQQFMPAKNPDLHGMVPEKSPVALLLIDVINDLEFPEGKQLLRHALPMARRLAKFKARAKKAGIPVLYVNDNFGKWQSDLRRLVEHCLHDDVLGEPIVKLLQPDEDDYFVLKPKHSGFYSTTLHVLLVYLQVNTVILAGIAGNNCVLFTANDAYLRDYNLVIPSDCSASNTKRDNDQAFMQMKKVLKADIRPSTKLDLKQLMRKSRKRSA